MKEPNIKNCTKNVKDYIFNLKLNIDSLQKQLDVLNQKQQKSNIYQDADYTNTLSDKKLYLNNRYPVYFLINDIEYQVNICDYESNKDALYVSSDKTIKILPRASNCFIVK